MPTATDFVKFDFTDPIFLETFWAFWSIVFPFMSLVISFLLFFGLTDSIAQIFERFFFRLSGDGVGVGGVGGDVDGDGYADSDPVGDHGMVADPAPAHRPIRNRIFNRFINRDVNRYRGRGYYNRIYGLNADVTPGTSVNLSRPERSPTQPAPEQSPTRSQPTPEKYVGGRGPSGFSKYRPMLRVLRLPGAYLAEGVRRLRSK